MKIRSPILQASLAAALLTLFAPAAFPAMLYSTDFSNFPVGDDQLVGFDGWTGNCVGEGVHGIGSNLVSTLGNSGWLGYGSPSTNIVRVGRDFGTLNGALPTKISFQSTLGVNASVAGGNDTFGVVFFSTNGVFEGGVDFDTSYTGFGIWRDDGRSQTHLSAPFALNQLFVLTIDIDFQQNVWSASLGGTPLFSTNFSSSVTAPNAGSFAFRWKVAALNNPGDNWLLFDDISISVPELRISSITRTNSGYRLDWTAAKAGNCQVQISTNLVTWSDLSGALIPASGAGVKLSYVDQTTPPAAARFYRIKQ